LDICDIDNLGVYHCFSKNHLNRYYKDKSGAWAVRSINPDDEITVTTIHNFMIDGEYLSRLDTDEIILGKEIPGGYGGDLEHLSLGPS
jgi:putative ABC transport system permease protein